MSARKTASLNPIAIIALGVTSVSFAAIFVRLSTAPAPVIAFWRLLIATVATWALAVKSGNLPHLPSRTELIQTGLAGSFLALHFWSWFQSLKLTTVASSTVLVATQPLFVIIAARLLWGERLSVRAKFGLLVAIIGTILIASSGWTGAGRLSGNTLAIVAAGFAAAYLVLGSKARAKMDVSLYTFWTYLVCTIVLGMIVGIGRYPLGPYSAINWWAFAGLGIICHIGGHTSFNVALGHVSPSVVSTAILGEPVGATIWAWVFFSELPSAGEIVGGLLVIVGLFVFMSKSNSSKLL